MMRIFLAIVVFLQTSVSNGQADFKTEIITVLKEQTIIKAQKALREAPETVTASISPRSAGGRHDFYSEGDYWWPDPDHPDGPFVQRDGHTNPGNFVDHRRAMIRLSQVVGTMASAYITPAIRNTFLMPFFMPTLGSQTQ